MNLTSKNLKQAGLINSVLIVLTFICESIVLFTAELNDVKKIAILVSMLALISGLFYSNSGYKKADSFSFKGFMCLVALSNIFKVIIGLTFETNLVNTFIIIVGIASCLIAVALAFTKNLGKKKSLSLAYVMFIINIISFLCGALASTKTLDSFVYHFQAFILAILVLVFVVAKYIDKENRKAK